MNNRKILFCVALVTMLISCEDKKKQLQTIDVDKKSETKIEVERTYFFGVFYAQLPRCTTCDDFRAPYMWVTPIIEVDNLSEEDGLRQMDEWEGKLRKLFGIIKVIDRDLLRYNDYSKISKTRQNYMKEEIAISTESVRGFNL